jgi:hypothetical protein
MFARGMPADAKGARQFQAKTLAIPIVKMDGVAQATVWRRSTLAQADLDNIDEETLSALSLSWNGSYRAMATNLYGNPESAAQRHLPRWSKPRTRDYKPRKISLGA